MSTTVEEPATIRELTRYVEREHLRLRTLLDDHHEQLVVRQPGHPEAEAALREVLGKSTFELRDGTADSRGRWIGVINAADGSDHD